MQEDESNEHERRRLSRRSMIFALGDTMFLMVVGSAANTTMVFVHSLAWNCVATLVIGMAGAMCVQIVLATFAAPFLGSIETMVPSMLVGMLSPMQICVVAGMNGGSTYWSAVISGAVFGLTVVLGLKLWARSHKPLPPSAFNARTI